jgi:hypothetical protein
MTKIKISNGSLVCGEAFVLLALRLPCSMPLEHVAENIRGKREKNMAKTILIKVL